MGMTRAFQGGYVRASVKHIDDRNQFILPMPFTDPHDPDYVTGLSDYASMNTPEGIGVQVPTPGGDLTFPLDLSEILVNEFRRRGLPHETAFLRCGHYSTGLFPFKYFDGYVLTRFLRARL